MKKRIFIGFAIEDEKYRNLLRGQARLGDSPIEFIDFSVKSPWDSAWKTNCRIRIKSCNGMIALLSKNTLHAEGARWEIKCAIEERIPLIGIHCNADDMSIPPEFAGRTTIKWTWDGIAKFINGLT